MTAAAIEWHLLLQVVWVSFAGGLGAVALFALVIFGSTRAMDTRRDGQGAAATAFSLLAGVAFLAFAALVVFAITIIVHKS